MAQGAGEVDVGVKGKGHVPADDTGDVVVGKVLQVKAHAENVAWNEAAGFGACYTKVRACKNNAHARARASNSGTALNRAHALHAYAPTAHTFDDIVNDLFVGCQGRHKLKQLGQKRHRGSSVIGRLQRARRHRQTHFEQIGFVKATAVERG